MGKHSDEPPLFDSAVASPEELLRRARARLRQAAAPATRDVDRAGSEIDLESGAALLGGWYHTERLGDAPVRWVARRFDFAAEAGEATHLELEALLPEESGFAELRARLWANDSEGDAFRLRPGWNRLLIAIPAGVWGPVHFSIDAGGAWCPLDESVNDDCRELSICVRRFALVRPALPRVPGASEPAAGAGAAAAGVAVDLASPPVERRVPAEAAPLRSRVFRSERSRRLDLIPALEARIGWLESELARWGGVEGRMSRLESRLHALESVVDRLAADLEPRLAAIEEAHRELRADVGECGGAAARRS
jgi:hypothetical protein